MAQPAGLRSKGALALEALIRSGSRSIPHPERPLQRVPAPQRTPGSPQSAHWGLTEALTPSTRRPGRRAAPRDRSDPDSSAHPRERNRVKIPQKTSPGAHSLESVREWPRVPLYSARRSQCPPHAPAQAPPRGVQHTRRVGNPTLGLGEANYACSRQNLPEDVTMLSLESDKRSSGIASPVVLP